jgi:hypothetical protein
MIRGRGSFARSPWIFAAEILFIPGNLSQLPSGHQAEMGGLSLTGAKTALPKRLSTNLRQILDKMIDLGIL